MRTPEESVSSAPLPSPCTSSCVATVVSTATLEELHTIVEAKNCIIRDLGQRVAQLQGEGRGGAATFTNRASCASSQGSAFGSADGSDRASAAPVEVVVQVGALRAECAQLQNELDAARHEVQSSRSSLLAASVGALTAECSDLRRELSEVAPPVLDENAPPTGPPVSAMTSAESKRLFEELRSAKTNSHELRKGLELMARLRRESAALSQQLDAASVEAASSRSGNALTGRSGGSSSSTSTACNAPRMSVPPKGKHAVPPLALRGIGSAEHLSTDGVCELRQAAAGLAEIRGECSYVRRQLANSSSGANSAWDSLAQSKCLPSLLHEDGKHDDPVVGTTNPDLNNSNFDLDVTMRMEHSNSTMAKRLSQLEKDLSMSISDANGFRKALAGLRRNDLEADECQLKAIAAASAATATLTAEEEECERLRDELRCERRAAARCRRSLEKQLDALRKAESEASTELQHELSTEQAWAHDELSSNARARFFFEERVDELRDECRSRQCEIDSFEENVVNLGVALDSERNASNATVESVSAARRELHDASELNADLQAQLSAASSENECLKQEITELQQRLGCEDRNDGLTESLKATLLQEIQDLHKDCLERGNAATDAHRTCKLLKSQVVELERNLHAEKESVVAAMMRVAEAAPLDEPYSTTGLESDVQSQRVGEGPPESNLVEQTAPASNLTVTQGIMENDPNSIVMESISSDTSVLRTELAESLLRCKAFEDRELAANAALAVEHSYLTAEVELVRQEQEMQLCDNETQRERINSKLSQARCSSASLISRMRQLDAAATMVRQTAAGEFDAVQQEQHTRYLQVCTELSDAISKNFTLESEMQELNDAKSALARFEDLANSERSAACDMKDRVADLESTIDIERTRSSSALETAFERHELQLKENSAEYSRVCDELTEAFRQATSFEKSASTLEQAVEIEQSRFREVKRLQSDYLEELESEKAALARLEGLARELNDEISSERSTLAGVMNDRLAEVEHTLDIERINVNSTLEIARECHRLQLDEHSKEYSSVCNELTEAVSQAASCKKRVVGLEKSLESEHAACREAEELQRHYLEELKNAESALAYSEGMARELKSELFLERSANLDAMGDRVTDLENTIDVERTGANTTLETALERHKLQLKEHSTEYSQVCDELAEAICQATSFQKRTATLDNTIKNEKAKCREVERQHTEYLEELGDAKLALARFENLARELRTEFNSERSAAGAMNDRVADLENTIEIERTRSSTALETALERHELQLKENSSEYSRVCDEFTEAFRQSTSLEKCASALEQAVVNADSRFREAEQLQSNYLEELEDEHKAFKRAECVAKELKIEIHSERSAVTAVMNERLAELEDTMDIERAQANTTLETARKRHILQLDEHHREHSLVCNELSEAANQAASSEKRVKTLQKSVESEKAKSREAEELQVQYLDELTDAKASLAHFECMARELQNKLFRERAANADATNDRVTDLEHTIDFERTRANATLETTRERHKLQLKEHSTEYSRVCDELAEAVCQVTSSENRALRLEKAVENEKANSLEAERLQSYYLEELNDAKSALSRYEDLAKELQIEFSSEWSVAEAMNDRVADLESIIDIERTRASTALESVRERHKLQVDDHSIEYSRVCNELSEAMCQKASCEKRAVRLDKAIENEKAACREAEQLHSCYLEELNDAKSALSRFEALAGESHSEASSERSAAADTMKAHAQSVENCVLKLEHVIEKGKSRSREDKQLQCQYLEELNDATSAIEQFEDQARELRSEIRDERSALADAMKANQDALLQAAVASDPAGERGRAQASLSRLENELSLAAITCTSHEKHIEELEKHLEIERAKADAASTTTCQEPSDIETHRRKLEIRVSALEQELTSQRASATKTVKALRKEYLSELQECESAHTRLCTQLREELSVARFAERRVVHPEPALNAEGWQNIIALKRVQNEQAQHERENISRSHEMSPASPASSSRTQLPDLEDPLENESNKFRGNDALHSKLNQELSAALSTNVSLERDLQQMLELQASNMRDLSDARSVSVTCESRVTQLEASLEAERLSGAEAIESIRIAQEESLDNSARAYKNLMKKAAEDAHARDVLDAEIVSLKAEMATAMSIAQQDMRESLDERIKLEKQLQNSHGEREWFERRVMELESQLSQGASVRSSSEAVSKDVTDHPDSQLTQSMLLDQEDLDRTQLSSALEVVSGDVTDHSASQLTQSGVLNREVLDMTNRVSSIYTDSAQESGDSLPLQPMPEPSTQLIVPSMQTADEISVPSEVQDPPPMVPVIPSGCSTHLMMPDHMPVQMPPSQVPLSASSETSCGDENESSASPKNLYAVRVESSLEEHAIFVAELDATVLVSTHTDVTEPSTRDQILQADPAMHQNISASSCSSSYDAIPVQNSMTLPVTQAECSTSHTMAEHHSVRAPMDVELAPSHTPEVSWNATSNETSSASTDNAHPAHTAESQEQVAPAPDVVRSEEAKNSISIASEGIRENGREGAHSSAPSAAVGMHANNGSNSEPQRSDLKYSPTIPTSRTACSMQDPPVAIFSPAQVPAAAESGIVNESANASMSGGPAWYATTSTEQGAVSGDSVAVQEPNGRPFSDFSLAGSDEQQFPLALQPSAQISTQATVGPIVASSAEMEPRYTPLVPLKPMRPPTQSRLVAELKPALAPSNCEKLCSPTGPLRQPEPCTQTCIVVEVTPTSVVSDCTRTPPFYTEMPLDLPAESPEDAPLPLQPSLVAHFATQSVTASMQSQTGHSAASAASDSRFPPVALPHRTPPSTQNRLVTELKPSLVSRNCTRTQSVHTAPLADPVSVQVSTDAACAVSSSGSAPQEFKPTARISTHLVTAAKGANVAMGVVSTQPEQNYSPDGPLRSTEPSTQNNLVAEPAAMEQTGVVTLPISSGASSLAVSQGVPSPQQPILVGQQYYKLPPAAVQSNIGPCVASTASVLRSAPTDLPQTKEQCTQNRLIAELVSAPAHSGSSRVLSVCPETTSIILEHVGTGQEATSDSSAIVPRTGTRPDCTPAAHICTQSCTVSMQASIVPDVVSKPEIFADQTPLADLAGYQDSKDVLFVAPSRAGITPGQLPWTASNIDQPLSQIKEIRCNLAAMQGVGASESTVHNMSAEISQEQITPSPNAVALQDTMEASSSTASSAESTGSKVTTAMHARSDPLKVLVPVPCEVQQTPAVHVRQAEGSMHRILSESAYNATAIVGVCASKSKVHDAHIERPQEQVAPFPDSVAPQEVHDNSSSSPSPAQMIPGHLGLGAPDTQPEGYMHLTMPDQMSARFPMGAPQRAPQLREPVCNVTTKEDTNVVSSSVSVVYTAMPQEPKEPMASFSIAAAPATMSSYLAASPAEQLNAAIFHEQQPKPLPDVIAFQESAIAVEPIAIPAGLGAWDAVAATEEPFAGVAGQGASPEQFSFTCRGVTPTLFASEGQEIRGRSSSPRQASYFKSEGVANYEEASGEPSVLLSSRNEFDLKPDDSSSRSEGEPGDPSVQSSLMATSASGKTLCGGATVASEMASTGAFSPPMPCISLSPLSSHADSQAIRQTCSSVSCGGAEVVPSMQWQTEQPARPHLTALQPQPTRGRQEPVATVTQQVRRVQSDPSLRHQPLQGQDLRPQQSASSIQQPCWSCPLPTQPAHQLCLPQAPVQSPTLSCMQLRRHSHTASVAPPLVPLNSFQSPRPSVAQVGNRLGTNTIVGPTPTVCAGMQQAAALTMPMFASERSRQPHMPGGSQPVAPRRNSLSPERLAANCRGANTMTGPVPAGLTMPMVASVLPRQSHIRGGSQPVAPRRNSLSPEPLAAHHQSANAMTGAAPAAHAGLWQAVGGSQLGSPAVPVFASEPSHSRRTPPVLLGGAEPVAQQCLPGHAMAAASLAWFPANQSTVPMAPCRSAPRFHFRVIPPKRGTGDKVEKGEETAGWDSLVEGQIVEGRSDDVSGVEQSTISENEENSVEADCAEMGSPSSRDSCSPSKSASSPIAITSSADATSPARGLVDHELIDIASEAVELGDRVRALPGKSYKDFYSEGDEGTVTKLEGFDGRSSKFQVTWDQSGKISSMQTADWPSWFTKISKAFELGDRVRALPGKSYKDFYSEGDEGTVTRLEGFDGRSSKFQVTWDQSGKISSMQTADWPSWFTKISKAVVHDHEDGLTGDGRTPANLWWRSS